MVVRIVLEEPDNLRGVGIECTVVLGWEPLGGCCVLRVTYEFPNGRGRGTGNIALQISRLGHSGQQCVIEVPLVDEPIETGKKRIIYGSLI